MALSERLLVVTLVVSGLAGCGSEPGSRSCTVMAISIPDVRVTDPLAPLTLTATVTANGRPLAGAELAYFIAVGRQGEQTVGRVVGQARTGDDGVARYVRQHGVDGLTFSDERIDRYSVEYSPINKIGNVQYCRARADARLTVG
ncbi:hypothetical protein ABZ570_16300 [Micromonospora sp. NPDC007271]|uniref:hypothetical protein n=1 Tax=Micromonospora sp. NPDC007271 TaxID=3154587 RepID=UPI0033F823EC